MLDVMELTDVEMFLNSQIFKNVFVVVKHEPCHVKLGQRFITVSFKVGIVNEIQDSSDSVQDGQIHCSSKNTEKHLLHVLVLGSCPLSCQ